MESFFSRYKNALVLIAILLVQIIALATQVNRPVDALQPDGRHVRLVRLWAAAVIIPFERLSTGLGHGVRGAWLNYVALRHVRQQNLELQKQIAQLRVERAALAEDALAGQRLSTLLHFQQRFVSRTVVAQVVGTSGSEQSRLLILDKGWKDGLQPGMPVMTPEGVVGKLRDVFASTSQLLLLTDATSGAGVMFQTTRTRGVLRGTSEGRLQIGTLAADPQIKPGEIVLTSGGDQVFPRGLPVGTVESIAPDPRQPPYVKLTLRPAASLTRLDEVFVITALGAGLSSQTEHELASDVATHAADIGAERLPGLHDPKLSSPADQVRPGGGAADVVPPPENSTNLVPKPRPVMHPDRYSPGAAPPAEDLRPGAPKP